MSPRRSDAAPLSVLQAFFVPTRSIWPNSYREIAAKADASRACVIQLSATKLFHDFVTGEIEIRNIERDMLWILEGRVEKEGWHLIIDTRLSIRAVTSSRNLQQSMTPPMKQSKAEELTPQTITHSSSPHSLILSDDVHTLHELSESPIGPSFAFSYTVPHTSSTHITLDDIPPQKHHSSLGKFARKISPRTKYVLEFSALLDPAHAQSSHGLPRNLSIDALSAPFLYQLASPSPSPELHSDLHQSRTASPLHFSLSSILDTLTSLGLDVLLMQNVSADYARHLSRHADVLWPGTGIGHADVDEKNMDEIRRLTPEQRRGDAFMLRWEAALFAGVDGVRGMGLLGRFLVVVRKP